MDNLTLPTSVDFDNLDVLSELSRLLKYDFSASLSAAVGEYPEKSFRYLKITAQLCDGSPGTDSPATNYGPLPIHLGWVSLQPSFSSALSPGLSRGILDTQCLSSTGQAEERFSHLPSPPRGDDGEFDDGTDRMATLDPLRIQSILTPPDSNGTQQAKRKRSQNQTHDAVPDARPSDPALSPADLPQSGAGSSLTIHQLQMARAFPLRKQSVNQDLHKPEPSSVDKFIDGIWKQIYSSIEVTPTEPSNFVSLYSLPNHQFDSEAFRAINRLCAKVFGTSRSARSTEIIMQAHWVDCFEARKMAIAAERPTLTLTESKMRALREACATLEWSEKELRNKLAIWRGYKELKDAGGWVSLVFAGSGIYRTCKYRIGFTKDLLIRLRRLRPSFEVAADTIHQKWRRLLHIIGEESPPQYAGHPHNWVVSEDGTEPQELASTYQRLMTDFTYRHIEDSEVDAKAWGSEDPREVFVASNQFCLDCAHFQSNDAALNECRCFPELYGGSKGPRPVQIFRSRGKNNGLVARCDFEHGAAIGEFVGLITKGITGMDVMQGGRGERQYQIYQGKIGNYTKFVNHSCAPNSQLKRFCWLGTERIIIVSQGIQAGMEITVDYSNIYWEGLDKICLCGDPCCRYKKRRPSVE